MASRNRLRQAVTATLLSQFKDWNLPEDIEYKSYVSIVDSPVTPKEIHKSYYSWKNAVRSVRLTGAFKVPAKPVSVETKPVELDPLEALSALSTEKEEN